MHNHCTMAGCPAANDRATEEAGQGWVEAPCMQTWHAQRLKPTDLQSTKQLRENNRTGQHACRETKRRPARGWWWEKKSGLQSRNIVSRPKCQPTLPNTEKADLQTEPTQINQGDSTQQMHPEGGTAGGHSANKPEAETDKDAGVGGGNSNIQEETTKSMQHRTKGRQQTVMPAPEI